MPTKMLKILPLLLLTALLGLVYSGTSAAALFPSPTDHADVADCESSRCDEMRESEIHHDHSRRWNHDADQGGVILSLATLDLCSQALSFDLGSTALTIASPALIGVPLGRAPPLS